MNLDSKAQKELLKLLNVNPKDISEYSYLKINHTPKYQKGPGLLDQTYQALTYLKIAYCLNLQLELPKRYLSPVHLTIGPNKNKTLLLDLRKYLDFKNSTINNQSISNFYTDNIGEQNKILLINPITHAKGLEINNLLSSNSIESIRIFHPTFKNLAHKIKKKYYKKFDTVIHIRRGDLLKINHKRSKAVGGKEEYDRLTSYKNVLKKLRNHKKISANDPIYVMSDMLEGDPVIDGLNASEFNFSYYYNYPELQKLKIENNYDLFMVEYELFKAADKRIFKSYWLTK